MMALSVMAIYRTVPDSWRFVTPKDLVPKIPRGFTYTHVHNCVWIHKSGMMQNEVR